MIEKENKTECVNISGGSMLSLSDEKPKPHAWIPDSVWLNLAALSHIHKFSNILDKVSYT